MLTCKKVDLNKVNIDEIIYHYYFDKDDYGLFLHIMTDDIVYGCYDIKNMNSRYIISFLPENFKNKLPINVKNYFRKIVKFQIFN